VGVLPAEISGEAVLEPLIGPTRGLKNPVNVRFRGESGHDRLRGSAFTVAIGGKAGMGFCTAMSAFDPKRTSGTVLGQLSLKTFLALAARNNSTAFSLSPNLSKPARHSLGGQNGWFEPKST